MKNLYGDWSLEKRRSMETEKQEEHHHRHSLVVSESVREFFCSFGKIRC